MFKHLSREYSIRAVPLPLLGPDEVRHIDFFLAGSPTAQCMAGLRDAARAQGLMSAWLAGEMRASTMLVGTGWDEEHRQEVRAFHQAWLNYRSEKGIARADTFVEQVVLFVEYGRRNELFPADLLPAVQLCFSFRDNGRGWHWEYLPTGELPIFREEL